MKKVLLFLFFVSLGIFIYSQDTRYKHYTVEDGLPSSTVYQGIQDHQGYIWFATSAGVSRFDGKRFETFTVEDGLPHNDILNIYLLRDSSIWFIPFNGIGCYFKNDSFHTFHPPEFKGFDIRSVHLDAAGNHWFGSWEAGLIQYKDSIIRHYTKGSGLPHATCSVVEDKTGVIRYITIKHFGIEKEGVLKFYAIADTHSKTGAGLSAFTTATGQIVGRISSNLILLNDTSYSVIFHGNEDKQFRFQHFHEGMPGQFLLGSTIGAYEITSTENGYNVKTYLDNINIGSFFKDREKNLWFTTMNQGVYFLSEKSQHIKNYDEQSGLINPDIRSIYRMKNGEVLLGSTNKMVQVMSDGRFNALTLQIAGESQNDIKEMLEIGGKVWIGSDYGLEIVSSNFQQNAIDGQYIPLPAYEKHSNSLKISKPVKGFQISSVKAVIKGTDNDLWIGFMNGICRLQFPEDSGIYSLWTSRVFRVTDLCMDHANERLWIGKLDGLHYLQGDSAARVTGHEVLRSHVTRLQWDRCGVLWVGTSNNGVYGYLDSVVVHYAKEDLFGNGQIRELSIDHDDLWVGTNKGLFKITLNRSDLSKKAPLLYLTKKDGLVSDEIKCIYVDTASVLIGTNLGLSVIDKKGLSINDYPPPIYISSFKVWGKDTTVSHLYNLSHKNSNLTIGFSGLTFSSGNQLQYKYLMEGIDRQWNTTTQAEVSYPILPPNQYTFKVMAINSDGIQSKAPAFITIVINPPFWKTWWFRAFIVAGALLILLAVVLAITNHYRTKHKLENQLIRVEQKALTAQMNPHFMSNALSSIQKYVVQNNAELASRYLMKFSKLTRLILEASRNDMVTLEDEIKALQLYLDIEGARFDNKFHYDIIYPEEINLGEIKIPAMFIQPFVENAVIHGLAKKDIPGKLSIFFKLENQHVKCVIEDNGIGRAASNVAQENNKQWKESVAMNIIEEKKNILKRLRAWDIRIKVTDLLNGGNEIAGTRVEITMPFEDAF